MDSYSEDQERGEEREGFKRLFFAVDLPGSVIVEAERLVESLDIPPSQVRWIRPGNLHLTLKFLGDVEEGRIPRLCEAARTALKFFKPVNIKIEGMGVFPNSQKPRIVWLGVGGDMDGFARLEGALSKELALLDFPPDERPFTPHLTIGRVKSDAVRGKLVRAVRQFHGHYIGEARIGEVLLYESALSITGSIYTKIDAFALRNG